MFDFVPQSQIFYFEDVWEEIGEEVKTEVTPKKKKKQVKHVSEKKVPIRPLPKTEGTSEVLKGFGLDESAAERLLAMNDNDLEKTIDYLILNGV